MRKDIFKIYFSSIGFTILCFLISCFLPHVEEVFILDNKVLNRLLNYDSEHYLKLATNNIKNIYILVQIIIIFA